MVKELSDGCHINPNIAKALKEIVNGENYDNGVRVLLLYASPKPEFF